MYIQEESMKEWFIFYCVKREEARIETNAIILGCLT